MKLKPSLIAIVFGLLFFFSCAAPQRTLRPGAKIETLHILLETSPLIPVSVKEGFGRELDDFILQYNSEKHKFTLLKVNKLGPTTLRIKVHERRFVTQGQQVAGATLSLLGLTLPFVMVAAEAPFYIFFYYFPRVRSVTETSLSEDINGKVINPTIKVYDSPGFLRSIETQRRKHIEFFDKHYLKGLVMGVERAYVTN